MKAVLLYFILLLWRFVSVAEENKQPVVLTMVGARRLSSRIILGFWLYRASTWHLPKTDTKSTSKKHVSCSPSNFIIKVLLLGINPSRSRSLVHKLFPHFFQTSDHHIFHLCLPWGCQGPESNNHLSAALPLCSSHYLRCDWLSSRRSLPGWHNGQDGKINAETEHSHVWC